MKKPKTAKQPVQPRVVDHLGVANGGQGTGTKTTTAQDFEKKFG